VKYKTFLDAFKWLIAGVLLKPWLKVGLHMLRKTAYLLGTWGGGDFLSELMPAARHKCAEEAKKYAKCSRSTMEVNRIFHLPENRVGKFKSIVCEEMEQAKQLNLQSGAYNMPMHQLAEEFITKSLNIGPNHPNRWNQTALLKAAMEYTVDVSGSDQLDAVVAREKWNEGIGQELRFIIQVQVAEMRARDQQAQAAAQQQGQEVVMGEATVFDSSDPPPAAKRQRISGVGEIVGKDSVAKCVTVKEKIQKLLELEVPQGGKGLSEKSKTFLSKTMKPALGCLRNHFNGDVDAFCTAWEGGGGKRFVMSKFSQKCCKGDGTTCGRLS
jgi:hypothetical protein